MTVKTYPCPTCKAQASGRGHLCHPDKTETPFTCEFCGKQTGDPRHVCAKILNNLEYYCKKCGRLAVYDTQLCEPKLVIGE